MIKNKKGFQIYWIPFFVSFALGMFYVYISSPKQRIVIKYPTPYNAERIYYQNDDGICYKYKAEEVKCTSSAFDQPIL